MTGSRTLRNKHVHAAEKHMARSDPALHSAMRRLEKLPAFPTPASAQSHFHSLARTILYQQLAGKAAATTQHRVKRLGRNGRFPTAGRFLELDSQEVRNCGVSSAKQAALRDLASRVDSRRLSLRGLKTQSDAVIIDTLTSVRGIGIWTAQMFLIFRLGRIDVLPAGDLGVQEGLRILDGLKKRPTANQLTARGEAWEPFRTFATWALYRVVDEHRLKATAISGKRTS